MDLALFYALLLPVVLHSEAFKDDHECFWRFNRRQLHGPSPVQLQRVLESEECAITCLALGPQTCRAFVLHRVTGTCKIYSTTKDDGGAELRHSSSKEAYFERNTHCSDADVEEILLSKRRARRAAVAGPPGPPAWSSEDASGEGTTATGSTEETDATEDSVALPLDIKERLWLEWSAWTPCSKSCDVGLQYRTFVCGNADCMKHANQTRTCRIRPCMPSSRPRRSLLSKHNQHKMVGDAAYGPSAQAEKYGVKWSDWSKWSSCSVTCGGGEKTRFRKCQGYGCQGKNQEKQPCGSPCPEWADWTNWQQCSQSCGGGSQKRTRACSTYSGCQGEPLQDQACNPQPCCTEWTDWCACSVTCGKGTTKRTRQCIVGGGGDASKEETEEKPCIASQQPVCCIWSKWSDWSTCGKSCGGGKRSRTRTNNLYGGKCDGEPKETEDCNDTPCPEWNPWQEWSKCTVSCGTGNTKRTRTCTVPNKCTGTGSEDKECNTQECPVWSPWEPWTDCSVSCGGGTQKRKRTCTVADKCPGDSSEEKECNKQICPRFEPWGEWIPCPVPCGGGQTQKERVCTIDENYCKGSKLNNDPACICEGPQSDGQPCNAHDCAVWSPWGEWSKCDKSCGGGMQTRTRTCDKDESFCHKNPSDESCKCEGKDKEENECNKINCAKWSEWNEWSECSASCNGGNRERTRDCDNDKDFCRGENAKLEVCMCPGDDKSSEGCNTQICPTWEPWSTWGECSQNCGGGVKKRTRECKKDKTFCALNPDDASCKCEPEEIDGDMVTNEMEDGCNEQTCAEWSPWKEWSECSVTCGDGTQDRKRTCKTDSSFCHGANMEDAACKCTGSDSEDQSCNTGGDCPVWEEWTKWGECTTTCGAGTQTRTRLCSRDDAPCIGDGEETQDCNEGKCPIWEEWNEWSECSVSCDDGKQTRTRTCSRNDAPCIGDAEETKDCNDGACPVWKEWGEWSDCSVSCDDGKQSRTRECSRKDAPCIGDNKETQDCNDGACPVWQEWGEWSDCTVTCADGKQTRTRTCSRTDAPCIGDDGETKDCNLGDCPKWGSWENWGPCSVSCDKGIETRKRTCSRTDAPCEGDDKDDEDTRECDKGECPQWTPWSSWTDCTVVCGGGSRTRARKCPISDGCAGLNEESDICNMMPCPDWGEWAQWSDCSTTCGGGQRSRTRTCPIEGGCTPGEPFELDGVVCNPNECPIWAQWGEWSQCSATCNTGQRVRKRNCTPPTGCLGRKEDFEECSDAVCAVTAFWSAWSPCTKTCAGGTQFRSRAQCPEGPPKCGVDREEQPCKEQPCPEWSEWEAWSKCSRTCGAGQRQRKRKCPIVNGCIGKATDIDGKPCNDVPC